MRAFTSEDLPQIGERSLLLGPTGSGKTALAVWMLRRFPTAPIIIYDTKTDPKFAALPRSACFEDYDEVIEASFDEKLDYLIFRPPDADLSDREALDSYLFRHYDSMSRIPAYVDELHSYQSHGLPLPGLTALLTRGRSRGITMLMAAQRPAWISSFAYTETQVFMVLRLTYESDRKKVAEFVPGFDKLPPPPRFGFWYFHVERDGPELMGPVAVDPAVLAAAEAETPENIAGGVIDSDESPAEDSGDPSAPGATKPRHSWL
jgi:hypothetical protein